MAQRARDGPVRHAEGIERVFIHHESRNAAFHSIRSMPGATEQFVGSVPPLLVEIGHVSTLQANPPSVLIDERPQENFCRCSIREVAKHLHRKLGIADIHRPRAFHSCIWNPGGTQHLALAVRQFPVRRNAVPRGVLRCVGVVQIRDLIVPRRRPSTTRVRTRHDGSFGTNIDLCLEGICRIRIRLLWRSLVDQKDGHGSSAGRNVHQTLGLNRAHGHVEPQTVGFGNRAVSCVYYTHRDSSFLRRTLPDLYGASVGTLDLGAAIVAPAQGHGHIGRVFVDEETQTNRRWEEAFLRGLAFLRRLLREAAGLGYRVDLFVLVGIRARLLRSAERNEKAGQIPVRGADVFGQPLLSEFVSCARANQIESQRANQAFSDLGGVCGSSRVETGIGLRRGRPSGCQREALFGQKVVR